ncbi:helix-turn-helix domain-containing protein [Streptomyces malaysiensis]|uniref:Helix-turn-helix domain-containing protein n=1 Tax=Streptomyces malaysiensis subsp. samsunensis TaxID=459658 RepID=A0A9X2M4X4_STRMQ|nr:helix-turn-helix transcriptional regulator [Streptomyces samsunensis]MCQ8834850.1 helix-turn-helix domain-containing protein [Streptomyces samsunensis]
MPDEGNTQDPGTPGTADDQAPVLSQRLDRLFRMNQTAGQKLTNNEVAEQVRQRHPGLRVSGAYLSALRAGTRVNPSPELLVALAEYFGVPPGYFLDRDESGRITEQLEMLEGMRNAGIRGIAMRAVGLSNENLEAVASVLDQIRKLQGLPPVHEEAEDDPTGQK